jgi:hypothetical protein
MHRRASIQHARYIDRQKQIGRQRRSVWASHCHAHLWNMDLDAISPDEIVDRYESKDECVSRAIFTAIPHKLIVFLSIVSALAEWPLLTKFARRYLSHLGKI